MRNCERRQLKVSCGLCQVLDNDKNSEIEFQNVNDEGELYTCCLNNKNV